MDFACKEFVRFGLVQFGSSTPHAMSVFVSVRLSSVRGLPCKEFVRFGSVRFSSVRGLPQGRSDDRCKCESKSRIGQIAGMVGIRAETSAIGWLFLSQVRFREGTGGSPNDITRHRSARGIPASSACSHDDRQAYINVVLA